MSRNGRVGVPATESRCDVFSTRLLHFQYICEFYLRYTQKSLMWFHCYDIVLIGNDPNSWAFCCQVEFQFAALSFRYAIN